MWVQLSKWLFGKVVSKVFGIFEILLAFLLLNHDLLPLLLDLLYRLIQLLLPLDFLLALLQVKRFVFYLAGLHVQEHVQCNYADHHQNATIQYQVVLAFSLVRFTFEVRQRRLRRLGTQPINYINNDFLRSLYYCFMILQELLFCSLVWFGLDLLFVT